MHKFYLEIDLARKGFSITRRWSEKIKWIRNENLAGSLILFYKVSFMQKVINIFITVMDQWVYYNGV